MMKVAVLFAVVFVGKSLRMTLLFPFLLEHFTPKKFWRLTTILATDYFKFFIFYSNIQIYCFRRKPKNEVSTVFFCNNFIFFCLGAVFCEDAPADQADPNHGKKNIEI